MEDKQDLTVLISAPYVNLVCLVPTMPYPQMKSVITVPQDTTVLLVLLLQHNTLAQQVLTQTQSG